MEKHTWNHYNNSEIKELRDVKPKVKHCFKPNGLCFAIDDDWVEFCKDEEFKVDTCKYKHTLTNLSELNILDVEKCKTFDKYIKLDKITGNPKIKWNKLISRGYDGIYVSSSLLFNIKTGISRLWGCYDVATIVVWNASKCKLVSPNIKTTSKIVFKYKNNIFDDLSDLSD